MSKVPVDPEVQSFLDMAAQAGRPPEHQLSVEDNRRLSRRSAGTAIAPEVARVADGVVPTPGGGIPVRTYWPKQPAGEAGAAGGQAGAAGTSPLLVWFHGGGFVLGDLSSADATARDLCAGSGAVVVNVDYPLAPEQPFPAAPEACWAVTSWLCEHAAEIGADPSKVAVGGTSAGGNLATVTALLARDRGGPALAFQLLVYPVIDLVLSFPSMRELGEGYGLTSASMEWFRGQYLGDGGDGKDPMASPIYAEDLSLLPPALVLTAEYDPLRDEGEAYAERLRLAGVRVDSRRYGGMIHGFFGMTAVAATARQAMADSVAALREALA